MPATSNPPTPTRPSIPARRDPVVVALGVVAIVAAVMLGMMARAMWHRPVRVVRIATGPRGGTFLPLGGVLARVLSQRLDRIDVRAVESAGGAGNIRQLERGEAELAFVANDVTGSSGARAIAPLYDEVLQIAVRPGIAADGIEVLRDRRIAIGPDGSGTNAIARRVLAHFGLIGHVTLREVPHLEAADAFARGDVDAIFVLAGLRAPAIERVLAVPGARLLALGDANDRGSVLEGVRVDAPFLAVAVIPARTYGEEPARALGSLGVRAVLVARADLSDDLVFDITRTLFEQKVRLASEDRLFSHLSESFDPGILQFPLHAGSVRYYRRNDPPFIVAWADTLSLSLTALVMAGSGLAALRTARRRRRKHRVERYYSEIQAASLARGSAHEIATLVAAKERLQSIRRRAFDELMADRLEADESFTIFQDYVRSELLDIDAEIRERRGVQSPSPSGELGPTVSALHASTTKEAS